MITKTFVFPGFEQIGLACGGEPAEFRSRRFPNGEWRIELLDQVQGCYCVIVGSVAPPDEQLLLVTLLAHTLTDAGAVAVELVAPYLSYSRQDRPQAGRSMTTRWLGKLLAASGISSLRTIDVHSRLASAELCVPVRSISPAKIFAEALPSEVARQGTFVAPDMGARERCENLRDALGRTEPIAFVDKTRHEQEIGATLHGAVGQTAVIVDDILDTGGTLCACAEKLLAAGAQQIFVVVSHALFTGETWKKLWNLRVQQIFTLDTLPNQKNDDARIVVLGSSALLAP
ncbi:MAG: ribose-phosphate diphosphokinase [Bdellovibrionota bacterium]